MYFLKTCTKPFNHLEFNFGARLTNCVLKCLCSGCNGEMVDRFFERSYCGEFSITTNTRLCSVHFTTNCYNNLHQVKSGYMKSPLTLVSGAEPTPSVPGLHPPIPLTAGATITATGIMCPPLACILPN